MRLSSGEKLTYLSDAMDELELERLPREGHGWNSLFTQTQQQQQPQSKDNPNSPESAQ